MVAVQPVCGGAGASSFAVTLALELAEADPKRTICLMDLDLQFGTVAASLDLRPEARVMQTYRNPRATDSDMFRQGLQMLRPNLQVFSAPTDILPIDALTGADLQYLLGLARDAADLVILDLPVTVTDWTEAVYLSVDRLYAMARLDVRSAGNLRRIRTLVSPRVLPAEKLFPVINFRPLRPASDHSQRLESFERGMGLPVVMELPDGGAGVVAAADSGIGLAQLDPGNPYRLAVRGHALELSALVPRQHRLQGGNG